MAEFTFRYGDGTMNFEYPEEHHLIVVSDIDLERSICLHILCLMGRIHVHT